MRIARSRLLDRGFAVSINNALSYLNELLFETSNPRKRKSRHW